LSVTAVTLIDTHAACPRDLAEIVAHKPEFKPNHPVVTVAIALEFGSRETPVGALLRRGKWTHND